MVFTRLADRLGILDIVAPRRRGTPSKTDNPQKQELLEGQLQRETAASLEKKFVKNHRVRYHHRATNSHCDAVIVGVHLDDGPDNPYYTISFKKQVSQEEEDMKNSSRLIQVEKQTTLDRLEPLPWDKEATWRILEQQL